MNAFQKIKEFILDTLFPISCLSCGTANEWICKECLTKTPLKNNQNCPFCEKVITPNGRVCFNCHKKSSLDGLLVVASYKNKLVSSAVHYYKYRFVKDLSFPLGEIMIKKIMCSEFSLPDIIIPVPLHKKRLRWRGFNQAQLLAKYLGKNMTPGLDIPVRDDLIQRYRYTSPQMKIRNYSQRKKNIEGAFRLKENIKKEIQEKSILLVDDIATTGATLFECAKILKKFGAKQVFGIVIARQENKKSQY